MPSAFSHRDLGLLADNDATVAHCRTMFVRHGIALNTLGEYERQDANLGIGTDTYSHYFLGELATRNTLP